MAVLLLAACKSADESPETRARELEEYAKSFGVDVDVDAQGKDGVVIKQDVGGAQFQTGKNMDVPDDFPKDVPIFPDLKILSAAKLPIGHLLQGTTGGARDAVAKFYLAELPKQGWANVTPPGAESPAMQSMRFTKDQRAVGITLMRTGADTTVQISLTPAG